MSPKFNINRPKVSDDEITQHQNFDQLVERFKQQSIKKARGDESWWKNKKIRYSAVIAGVTVVCTVTYLSLFTQQKQNSISHETLTTQNTTLKNNKPKTITPFIQAPSSTWKTPYSTYKINNAKGGTIKHPSASKIKIPQNSFVDKNGKEVIGDVIIEYKEFHDAGDIIVNGIPMAYDSAGLKYNLETAGMFDIRGSQNGNAVFIKPDKTLQVELASASAEQKYNQYYLDTAARNWTYLQKDHAVELGTGKGASLQSDAKTKQKVITEKKLQALKNDIEVLVPKKSDSVAFVYTRKLQKLTKPAEPVKPVKAKPGKASFKLDGSYDEFPELSSFNNVLFEVGAENKNYNKELHEITWSDVKVSQGPQKGKNYVLTLVYRNRIEKLIVYPVLNGEEFEKAEAIYEQKFANYEAQLEKRTQEEIRLMIELKTKQAAYLAEQKKKQEEYDREKAAMQAKYDVAGQNELQSNFNNLTLNVKATRLFNVSKFGIFNSDCPHPTPTTSSLKPTFVLNEKEKLLIPDFVYLIDHSNKSVYTFDRNSGFALSYDPKYEYSLCVFKQNKMYRCSKAEFKQVTESQSKKFILTPLSDKADNFADFKKAIEI
jgi:hypothetical protein